MTTTPQEATPRRGDVVLVLFPHSDLRTAKPRPALVVKADDLGTGMDQVIVAMITSNMARAGHPSRVEVLLASPAGRRSGLIADSVVVTDNLATVLVRAVDRVIGRLPMPPIDAALKRTLGL